MQCVHLQSAVKITSSLSFCAFSLSSSIHGWAQRSLQTPWETGKTQLTGSWNMTLWYSPGWEWVCSNVTYQSAKEEEVEEVVEGWGANKKINTKAAFQHLAKEANKCSAVVEKSWNIMEILHPPSKKTARLQCVMWKLCLVTAARSVHII